MTTRKIEIGDYVITDFVLYNRVTGAVREVIDVQRDRIYLNEKAPLRSSNYVKRKSIIAVFKDKATADAIVEKDKEFHKQVDDIHKLQANTILEMIKNGYEKQDLNVAVA